MVCIYAHNIVWILTHCTSLTVPLPTSPPTSEPLAETLSPQPLDTPLGTYYIVPLMQHSVSDNRIYRERPFAAPRVGKPQGSSALDACPAGSASRSSSAQEIITETDVPC